MVLFSYFSRLLALLAISGYLINGMQTHLQLHPGETFSIKMCGGSERTVALDIKGAPAEPTEDTCCGDCVITAPPPLAATPLPVPHLTFAATPPRIHVPSVYPRSPLWPGAPPQGPPTILTI